MKKQIHKRSIRYVLAFLLIFLLQNQLNAQDLQKAKITLINGTRIEGYVVESMHDKYIKIDVIDNDPLIINYHVIRKIRFYQGKNDSSINEPSSLTQFTPGIKTKVFFHEVTGNLMFGQDNLDVALHTVNGYQYNRYLGAGIGLGIEHLQDYSAMPVYAQVKGYLFDRKVTPFYFGDIGYAFAWGNSQPNMNYENFKVHGGLYWQLGIGYQLNFPKGGMVFKFGYRNQSVKTQYSYLNPWYTFDSITSNSVEVQEDLVLRRFVLGIGFLF